MGRRKDHRVLNVYSSPAVETVETAISLAMQEEGIETESEAIRVVAAAYSGYDPEWI